MKARNWMIIALAVAMVACAAGQKQYDVGMQLSQAGKYDEALAYLRQAIEKEPNNTAYKKALDDLQNKLVETYIADGEKALGPADATTAAKINRAKAKLGQAKGIMADHPKVAAFADRIENRERALTADIKRIHTEAKQAIAEKNWGKAYVALQQIQSRIPNYEDTRQLINQVEIEGVRANYDLARQHVDRDELKAAIDALHIALGLQPDHAPSRALLREAQQRDNKGYFVKKAGKAVQLKKWDEAVAAYETAQTYDTADAKVAAMITKAKALAAMDLTKHARQEMEQGYLLRAFDSYMKARDYSDSPDSGSLLQLQRDLSARGGLTAGRLKEMGHYGSAWYWYQQVKRINSAYPDIFYLSQAMEDKIKARVRKSIAVFDFSSPSDHKDSGIIVANNLITYLFKNASGDIKILERENLRAILEEMKLGQIGVVPADSAKEMGRVYGIDVAIMGSVLLYKVDSNTSRGLKTVRYQVGTKIEDNIEYLNWLAKHPDPSDEERAAAPAAKIQKPEYAEKDYEVSHHKKIAFIQLSFRIVDVSTGENIQVKTVERKEVAEDEASAGLKEAGVNYDPLEMPTDTELLQKMTEEVVAELGREALRPLQNLENEYFKDGDTYMRRRNIYQAVERFVDATFDERLKQIDNSPLSQKAMDNIRAIFINHQMKKEG